MRNFLLLFINVLVFSSISFSQITPSNGQNRCQNQAFNCLTDIPSSSYAWTFTGVAYSYVNLTTSTSASPQINCSGTGTLSISVTVDGGVIYNSSVTINGQPGVPSYQNGSSFCLSNSNLQSPNAPVTAGGTYSVIPNMIGFNAITGQFTPSVVGVNSYIVKYALPFSTTGCLPVSSLPITVNPIVTPIFTQVSAICSGGSLSALPTTSNNGITGTWSPVLNNTATTNYTFTPTAGLCATTTTKLITVNPNVTPTFTPVSPICAGASLSALPTTSNNGITGTWSPVLNNTATTNYTFTPTAGLCATTTTKLITVNPNVTPTFTPVSPICAGASLSPLPTSSTNIPAITGTWSPALNNTATTNYLFTPTTGLCATTTTTMAITVTAVPDVTINYGDNAFCSNESPVLPDLTLGVEAFTGGTYSVSPLDLSIDVNTGEIDPSTSTAGGNYTVSYSIDPADGCAEVIVDVIVEINLLPLVSISYASYPFCKTLGVQSVNLSGPTGGTYSVSPVAGLELDPITGDVNPSQSMPGLYYVDYTIDAGNGCVQVIASAEVEITGIPTAFISYPGTPFCSSDSEQQVLIEGGTYEYQGGQYAVSPNGLSIDVNTGEIDPSSSIAGTYIVTYTTPAAGGCASVSDSTIVVIEEAPYVTTSTIASTTFCDGGNVNIYLDAGIGNLFQWYIEDGGNTTAITGANGSILDFIGINYNATITGNYFCEVIDPTNGCSTISDTTEVIVYGLPSIPTITGNAVFCQGSSTTLASSPAVNYLWSTGAFTSNIVVNTAGSYSVTVTNAEGCDSDSDPYTVNMTPLPDPTTSIIYEYVEFCKTIATWQNVFFTGTTGGTFTASNPGLIINANTGAINPSLSTAGTYTVIYTIAAAGGCAELNTITTVEITTAPDAIISYNNSPFCKTLGVQAVTQTGTAGGLYTSTAGLSINASTGAITPSTSTAGTYIVTYTIDAVGGCAAFSTTVSVTIIAAQSATISYPSSPFCKSNTSAQSVFQNGTQGGTYSAIGLLINTSTGAITPSQNSPGTYLVTYFLPVSPSGCSAVSTIASVTITAAPSATISYTNSPYCQTLGVKTVTQTGTPGGTYSSTTGLIINANTGAITPSLSTEGTYTVIYTIDAANGCAVFSTTTNVTIIAAQSASISYPSSPFCKTLTSALSVTQNGTLGGSYSALAGLSLNASTGAIIPSLSAPGTYLVTYFLPVSPSGCSAVSTIASVTITAAPSASISYASLSFCQTLGVQTVTQTGTPGGTYSSSAGLTIDANTGAITPSTSTAGAYIVTYTIAASGGCAAVSTSASVTIIAAQSATISYPSSPFCKTLTSPQLVTQNGTPGGVYSYAPIGLSISPSTGAITPSTSSAGTYTVTYTNAAAGGCIATSTTTTVTITGTPTATISYTGTPFCSTLLSQAVSLLGTYSYSGGTYSFSPPGLSINILTGVIDPSNSLSGNYIVEYTTLPAFGCAAVVSLPAPVTITTAPSATISYTNSPFCKTITTPETVSRIGTPGGTYSAPLGLSISASTGAITPSTSTPGTYNVTYTFAASAGCPLISTNASVIITAAPNATISYPSSPFCKTLATEMFVSQSGQTGGTYSASPTGLSINASTGAITPSTSTAGTYTVTYTIAAASGCAAFSTPTSVTITTAPSASISYPLTPYCKTLTLPQPVSQTGTTLGTYSAPLGLIINASTGAITPSTSTAGTYLVTYTLAASAGCAAVNTTASVTITAAPSASISYANASFCNTLINAQAVSQSGTTGGTYSADPTGLHIIDPNTGAINPSTSTAGTYTVTYTIAASSGCAVVSTTTLVTITTAPSASISYPLTPYCKTLTAAQSVSQSGPTGGTYSSTSGLIINGTTGAITPNTSTPGTYTVTYTLAASSACAAVSTTTSVTITTAPNASITYTTGSFCNTITNSQPVTQTGTTGGTYSSSPIGLSMDPNTGAITPNTSAPGTYVITYTIAPTGTCAAVAVITNIIIKAAPSATISYPSSPWCNTLTLTQPVIQSGTTGGVYSSTPPGLSINSSSGSIALATSAVGSYTVSYTMPAAGGCSAVTTTTPVAIIVAPSATISYANPTWCNTLTTIQAVSLSGTTGGTYSSNVSGLSIDQTTGAITPNLSSSGSYTVTYTIAAGNGCAAVSTTTLVTITPAPVTSISYVNAPFCQTLGVQSVDPPGTTGGTYSASPLGLSINASTGAITPSTSTAGTYTITYTLAASAGCAAVIINPNVTITAAPSASISYANSPFCKTLTSPQSVIITGTSGGTYSASPPGLNIDSYTGAIIPSTSIAGTYIVTYKLAATAGCAEVNTTANVTITTAPSATISYLGSPFCQTLLTEVLPVIPTGTLGGVYTTIPVGLSINSSTGAITPSLSTAGTYPVTYTIAAAGGCSEIVATQDITIIAAPGATISYPVSPFCKTLTTAPVTQSGTIGGTYSSTTGLSINANTGAINPSLSTAGTYTVTYTIAATGPCATVSTTTSVTITTAPSATISYPSSSFCNTLTTGQAVFQSGTPGGTYTSTTGLSINASTGAITPSTSTGGTYTVTYTIAAASGCSAVSTTASVTIIAAPNASISYASSSFCNTITSALAVTLTGTPGGAYSSNASGLSIDQTTGAITPSTSTAGTYIVTYTLPATSPCAVVSSTASVTITTAPSATISYPPSPWCNNLSNVKLVSQSGTPGGTYSSTLGLSINPITGTITPSTSIPGTYTVIYTIAATGPCELVSTTASVTISAPPSATINYNGSPNPIVLCPGDSINLTAAPSGMAYSWNTPTVPNSTQFLVANTAGPYSVVVTDPFTGCSAQSTSIPVSIQTLNTTPASVIGMPTPLTICPNSSISITGVTTNANLYSWTLTPATMGNLIGASTLTPQFTSTGLSGTATLTLNTTINHACNSVITSTQSITIVVNSSQPTLSHAVTSGDTNQVLCSNNPIIPIIYNVLSITGSSAMTTTVLINGSSSNPYNGISWSVSGTVVTISGTPTFGTYTYVISSVPTGPTGCVATTKTGTIVSQPASLILSSAEFTNNQIICIGNSIVPIIYNYTGAISAIDLPPGVTAVINTANGTYTLSGTPTVDGYFNYAITTETLCGFETLLGEITVVQNDPSMIGFGGADQTISLGGSVELVTNGTSISNYNWSPSSGLSSSTISNPFASPVTSTTYTVTAQDAFGCTYTDDIIVNVLTDYTLTIPSLITPNGDGSNDFWEIPESLFYPNTSVLIINREGQEVYKSSSYDNTWNGTFDGKLLPEATYYYFIQFPNSEKTHKGPITILRSIK